MSRTGGFTLIELLVAMLAGSLLMLGLGAALGGLGTQLRRSIDVQRAHADTVAADTLARLLERAQFPGQGDDPVAIGTDRVRLPVLAPDALAPGKVVTLQLTIEPHGDSQSLIARFLGPNVPSYRQAPVELLAGLRGAAFAAEGAGDSSRQGLPGAILLTYSDAKGVAHQIVGIPRAPASGACRYDLISQLCRP